jgi:transcriptional regulator with XRE-family HTH domain
MGIIMNYSSSTSQELSFHIEPMFKKYDVASALMNVETKKHPKTVICFVRNLKYLLEITDMHKNDIAKKAGVSARYIDYLLKYEKYPTIEIAENIGQAFGLNGWHMILPDLDYELGKNGKLDEVLKEFTKSSKVTQDFVTEVLHKNAM